LSHPTTARRPRQRSSILCPPPPFIHQRPRQWSTGHRIRHSHRARAISPRFTSANGPQREPSARFTPCRAALFRCGTCGKPGRGAVPSPTTMPAQKAAT
jgi:hypothetical protein